MSYSDYYIHFDSQSIARLRDKFKLNDMKEVKIQVPEGHEIDKDNSTFECIKFKKITKVLPSSWNDYVRQFCYSGDLLAFNLLPDKYIALCKLELLRDCYNDGWVADWGNVNDTKYCVSYYNDEIVIDCSWHNRIFLNFKTPELGDLFIENFKGLIEEAKELL